MMQPKFDTQTGLPIQPVPMQVPQPVQQVQVLRPPVLGEPVVYDVTDCGHACQTCGGTQKIILHPEHAVYEHTINMWGPICCVTLTTTRPYHKLDQILVDKDICCLKIMVPGLTNVPFRGPCVPFVPMDQAKVKPMVDDLQYRINRAVHYNQMERV